jgi:serine/threonine protein kinase
MSVILQRIIEVGDKIGKGGYGQVFKGTFREYNTTTPVALKKAQQLPKPEDRAKADKAFEEEANNLKEFAHLFVVKFFGVWQFEDHK